MTNFILTDSFFVYFTLSMLMLFLIPVMIGLYNLEKDDKTPKKLVRKKKA